ncbi:MAG TPA: RraA family protein, partial [Propionibacteriaceae bacterium]
MSIPPSVTVLAHDVSPKRAHIVMCRQWEYVLSLMALQGVAAAARARTLSQQRSFRDSLAALWWVAAAWHPERARARVGQTRPFVVADRDREAGMTTTPEVLDRLRALGTSSLVDAGGDLRVLPLDLRPVGRSTRLVGRVVTADAGADLMSVIAGLQACGPGDVLVVAAGGNERAVAGELFATEALRRGVAGLVVDGRVRDVGVLAELDLPVFARGVAPHAYPAGRVPRVQVSVTLGDVEVRSGDLLIGDADGLVVGS